MPPTAPETAKNEPACLNARDLRRLCCRHLLDEISNHSPEDVRIVKHAPHVSVPVHPTEGIEDSLARSRCHPARIAYVG